MNCHPQNSSINLISSNSALNNITNTNIAAAAAASAASSSYTAAAAAVTSPSFSTSQKIRFHERRGSLIRLSNNNRKDKIAISFSRSLSTISLSTIKMQ